jgi:uncharacterized damage-inducible protein DinB
MTVIDAHGRPEPPHAADEADTLLGFLDYQRATLEWKTRGLDAAGMTTTVAASSMTPGGLLKHMALVEDDWFSRVLHANERAEPWRSVDWQAEPDWEWTTAADDSPEQLRELWRESVDRSRELTARALSTAGMEQPAKRPWADGKSPSLRWIVTHMIEEYARHNGHADVMREAIDGQTGE